MLIEAVVSFMVKSPLPEISKRSIPVPSIEPLTTVSEIEVPLVPDDPEVPELPEVPDEPLVPDEP